MHYLDLGYADYRDYLKGPEWHEIKNYYFKHCGPYRCRICLKKHGLVLHKRSYAHLSLSSLKRKYWFEFLIIWYLKRQMVYLCSDHHHEVHYYKKSKKVKIDRNALMSRENYLYLKYLPVRFIKHIW